MEALLAEAQRLRVVVRYAQLPPPRRGFYSPMQDLIVVHRGLILPQRREALAHELGHAFHGHDCTSTRTETQAWRRAAELTVDPAAYARAEEQNPHPSAIAQELELTTRLILAWRTHCPAALNLERNAA